MYYVGIQTNHSYIPWGVRRDPELNVDKIRLSINITCLLYREQKKRTISNLHSDRNVMYQMLQTSEQHVGEGTVL